MQHAWRVNQSLRTYTHLAAIDLLDHANAIRLPTILPTVPVSTDPEAEDNLNVISGVDEGIRTPNNRNHNPRSLASTGAALRAVVRIFPPR
jgi:hypothetical protein